MIFSECTLVISLNTIKRNYQALQKVCVTSEVGAAVKANCYGLGVKHIVPILFSLGCRHFFVANRCEGVFLREILEKEKQGSEVVHIYVLNGYFINAKDDFIKYNLIPVINSLNQLELWSNLACQLNKRLSCVLHIDTGMNRLGIQECQMNALLPYSSIINVLCVMSHLSSSEELNSESNSRQLTKFKRIGSLFPYAKKSLTNSSGIFLGLEYHFDITRPGSAIYGLNPTPYILEKSIIENPISLRAPIIQIESLNEGQYVGYNGTYQANEKKLVATLPLGYADGYLRSLSNKGIIFINGKPAPVIGRVSMDLITIDVTRIPMNDLFLGQEVEIIGKNMNLDRIADLAGTSGYEILTMLGNRYNRVYS